MKRLFLVAALLIASCDALPRDPEGTLERVRADRAFRVGVIAGGTGAAGGREAAFLRRIGAASGARPLFRSGPAEALLLDLENGKLDLVIGELAEDTPWIDRVALLPPLATTHDKARPVTSVAARGGENRWIMLLEREARALDGGER